MGLPQWFISQRKRYCCFFCCQEHLFLHLSSATEVPGTFRVSGSSRRMRELQAAFETPPRVRSSVTAFSVLHSHPILSTAKVLTGDKKVIPHTMLPAYFADTSPDYQYVLYLLGHILLALAWILTFCSLGACDTL